MDRATGRFFTKRQIQEFNLALFYKQFLNHGTDGHHRLLLLANFAEIEGFILDSRGLIVVPDDIAVIEEPKR